MKAKVFELGFRYETMHEMLDEMNDIFSKGKMRSIDQNSCEKYVIC